MNTTISEDTDESDDDVNKNSNNNNICDETKIL